jgi:hypothetical protein
VRSTHKPTVVRDEGPAIGAVLGLKVVLKPNERTGPASPPSYGEPVSTYPFWLLTFDLREDLEEHVLEVLSAVGDGAKADPAHLLRLPDEVRSYLQEPERMQSDQGAPVAGTPVRIARNRLTGLLTLTFEFCQHDDQFANGGWLFYLWVLNLAHRPGADEARTVIGHHGLYRNDSHASLVYMDGNGVTEHDMLMPFAEIEAVLAAEEETA